MTRGRRTFLSLILGGLACPVILADSVAGQHTDRAVVPVEPFDAVFFERSRTIRLAADPDEVFPLFTPDGRQRWSGFDPVMLRFPEEGWEGAVYLQPTIHPEPNTGVVVDYDPARRFIRYLTFIPRAEAWEMEIQVGPLDEGSYATVTYRVTSLSREANPEITQFFQGHFDAAIDGWASAIDSYLGG
jgi:hypothetical protein